MDEKQPQDKGAADDAQGMADFLTALGGDVTGLKIEEPVADTVDDAPPSDESASTTGKKPALKPKKLKELSTYAKLSDDELYAIEVPSSLEGAEPYTIGKLKDLAAEHDEFKLNGLRRDQQFRETESKLLRAEQELRELFAALPKDAVKALDGVREKLTQTEAKERQRVLEVIPAWQDRETRLSELGAMVEHLKDNGFPESFLQSVLDHRVMRYIRNNMVRDARIKQALEKVKARKPTTPPKGVQRESTRAPSSGRTQPRGHAQRQIDNFENVLLSNTQRN